MWNMLETYAGNKSYYFRGGTINMIAAGLGRCNEQMN